MDEYPDYSMHLACDAYSGNGYQDCISTADKEIYISKNIRQS
jgi:hypothetical protein